MDNTYTVSTVDSSAYKSQVCGRVNDIGALLDHIASGHSVALFGERRIGKTSVLYVVRDIINGNINLYQAKLIDADLENAVPRLARGVTRVRSIYLDCLRLQNFDSASLATLFVHELQAILTGAWDKGGGKLKSFRANPSFLDVVEMLHKRLANDERFVVLLDEVDVLLSTEQSKQIFQNLKSIVQSCNKICFVLAGAELWHKEITERAFPLINNVYVFYLRAAEFQPIERYLIRGQLRHYLSPSCDIDVITATVIEWTGCKPWYVQAVCYEVVQALADGELPDNWEATVEERVVKSVGSTLEAFFLGDNVEDISRKILALLTNNPNLTPAEISRDLGLSGKLVWERLHDLEALDKIRKTGSKYRIVGKLLEKWGKKTQEAPRRKSPWPQRLKWVSVILLMLLATWLYAYTNPAVGTFPFQFAGGIVSVRMPSSLEQDESGIATVLMLNTSADQKLSATVSLNSTEIDYRNNGTNRTVFEGISAGETKYWEPNFAAHSAPSGNGFSSNLSIAVERSHFSAVYAFQIPRRLIPLKKYAAIISLLLVAISAFMTKQNLWQLTTALFSGVLGSKKDGEQKQKGEQNQDDKKEKGGSEH